MRLVQLLSAWRSNGSLEADAIAMDRMLRNMGFRTGIYAKGGTGAALPPEQMPDSPSKTCCCIMSLLMQME